MGQRILFFENDARFAQEVRTALFARGVDVEITNDGNAGVDRAVELKPDLILLTIELPGVNGFLVCKKLRKLPETQSVPMIILSSEATEEVFEQHRRLRTRAEDYVHKPVSLDALIGRIHAIVPLPPAREEELDVAFGNPSTEMHSAAAVEASVGVDQEIEAFADSAFDALVVGEEEATTVGVLSPAAKAVAA
ncbi:MAG: response regulator, partial [Sandaracinaceae bacterium]|nr:response regulator [Sandaracinaceae bacterium]